MQIGNVLNEISTKPIGPALGAPKSEKSESAPLFARSLNQANSGRKAESSQANGPRPFISSPIIKAGGTPPPSPAVNDENSPIDDALETDDQTQSVGLQGTWQPQGLKDVNVQPRTETDSADLTPKQNVMMKFMREMETQVGVKPTRIVDAMAHLDKSELMRSPESTMNQVLNGLQLNPAQRAKAEVLYQKMLDDTAAAAMKEIETGKANPVQVKVLDLNQSIDKMNGDFFSQGNDEKKNTDDNQVTLVAGGAGIQAAPVQTKQNVQAVNKNQQKSSAKVFDAGPKSAGPTEIDSTALAAPKAESEKSKSEKSVDQLQTLDLQKSDFQPQQTDKKTDAFAPPHPKTRPEDFFNSQAPFVPSSAEAAVIENSNVYTSAQAMAANQAVNMMNVPNAEQEDASDEVNAAGKSPLRLAPAPMLRPKTEAKSAKNDNEIDDFDNDAEINDVEFDNEIEGNHGENLAHMHESAAAENGAQFAPATSGLTQTNAGTRADQIKNIQEVMQKAQFLVRQGGGEMKIQLHPEGLGQVHLKVQVNDRQVSIQMLTQNQDAKRSLESGLHDLNTHLAAHNLKLDAVKVDVGREASGDFNQNRQQQPQQQQLAREFARNFMGSFRENRQSRREGMFDAGVISRPAHRYGKQKLDDNATRVTSARSSRRLNLVA